MNYSSASDYFQHIVDGGNPVSKEKIKTILAAAILRYLGGLTTIDYVLDLYTAIRHKADLSLHKDLVDVNLAMAQVEHQIICKNGKKDIADISLRRILEIL